jgi:hypothetical protein
VVDIGAVAPMVLKGEEPSAEAVRQLYSRC